MGKGITMNISKIVAISLMISMSFNSASFAMNIFEAVKAGDCDRVRVLIQADPNALNAKTIRRENTPLHCAAKSGQEAVVRLLLKHGADVEACNRDAKHPLHCAAKSGQEAVVRLLLEHGAAVNAFDGPINTPLHWAANVAVVRLLLEHGAAVDIRNRGEYLPSACAAWCGHEAICQLLKDWPFYVMMRRLQSLAFVIAMHDRIGDISPAHKLDDTLHREIYMWARGSHPHSASEIHRMAEQARIICAMAIHESIRETVPALVDGFLKAEVRNDNIHKAAQRGDLDAVKAFLQADPDGVDVRDQDGRTPLHCAAERNRIAIAQLLLERGADVNAQDHLGNNPSRFCFSVEYAAFQLHR